MLIDRFSNVNAEVLRQERKPGSAEAAFTGEQTRMNGKRLVSLILALFLLAVLPLSAFAEEGEAAAEERIAVQFINEQAADLSYLVLFDGLGQPVAPYSDDSGLYYGCYTLEPGTYYYYFQDPSGSFAELGPVTLPLEEGTVAIRIELNLAELGEEEMPEEAEEEEAEEEAGEEAEEEAEEEAGEEETEEPVPMPVILRSEDGADLSGLAVFDANGVPQSPYQDPETGELQLGNYLLLPGDYSYFYHDPAGLLADCEGRFTVTADGVQRVTLKLTDDGGLCFTGAVVNPVYADLIDGEQLPQLSMNPEDSLARLQYAVAVASGQEEPGLVPNAYRAGPEIRLYDSAEAAGAALKRSLQQRQQEVTLRLVSELAPSRDSWWQLCASIYNTAIRHSGAPTEGDYLRYEYGGVRCGGSVTGTAEPGIYVYEFQYAPLYFTTQAQEAELDKRVAGIMAGLALAGKSDEQKIRSIYSLLCANVGYLDSEEPLAFTAYSALLYGRATCQGVAVAFYRLCLEAGVDVRVVTSTSLRHAWNIARVDGNRYYALDATWDSGKEQDDWAYYLKGRTSWAESHGLGDEFENGSFGAYTFPAEDYGGSSFAVIHSVSLLFDGMLRIKYYFVFPESLLAQENACVQFSRGGAPFQTVPLSAGRAERSGLSFSCGVKVEDIAVPVQVRVLDGSGNYAELRSESGTIYANGLFFSAMEYARQMKTASSNPAMRALAQALEDYGVAAQVYFKHDGAESVSNAVQAVSAAELASWSIATEGEKPAGVDSTRISVVFEADNSLRVYYVFDGSVSPLDYTYTVDGSPAGLRQRSDGALYLSVENIGADHLHEAHRFSISDGTRTHIVTASVLGYAKTAIERGSESVANLGRALYLYNRAARAYF